MPELPEVEGVVRELAPAVEGKTIKKVEFSKTVYESCAAGKQCIVKEFRAFDILKKQCRICS